jgi:hypothetical protein
VGSVFESKSAGGLVVQRLHIGIIDSRQREGYVVTGSAGGAVLEQFLK